MEEGLPDDIVQEVTPWRKAMGNIIGGSGMCAITINMLQLNVLLPTIGVILQLLGFRSLRRENRWLGACWVLALLRVVLFLPVLVVDATIYREVFYSSGAAKLAVYGSVGTQLLLFFCLWRGLRAAQKKTGLPVRGQRFGPGRVCRLGGGGFHAGVLYLYPEKPVQPVQGDGGAGIRHPSGGGPRL